jgi:methionyl-tRNA formyltransferase
LMLMRPKMDAGPTLAQMTVPIAPTETAGELEARLAEISARLLTEHIGPWLRGRITPLEQDERLATYTTRLNKSDGVIDWEQPADLLARRVRAFNPWPAAFTEWNGRLLKILRAHVVPGQARPGQTGDRGPEPLSVGTGEGLLSVDEIQLAGGKPLTPLEALRGHPGLGNAVLGKSH